MRQVNAEEADKNIFKDKPMIWIDCEMTGLDLKKDRLIEIAVVITDKNLEQYIEGPNLVINQSDKLLKSMDEWCTITHGESGLTDKVRKSTLTEAEAQCEIINFIEPFVSKGSAVMAGSSIHVDKRFIEKYMPNLASYFTYRIIDVSTIKELSCRWYSHKKLKTPKKVMTHRALDDIYESIKELQYYKDALFEVESPRVLDRSEEDINTLVGDIGIDKLSINDTATKEIVNEEDAIEK